MENVIEVKHLNKSFGTHEVLKDIDFSVEKGEVVCIIGSSGSGKSTLLRCINLLEIPSGGEIIYNGENTLIDNRMPISLSSVNTKTIELFYRKFFIPGKLEIVFFKVLFENGGNANLVLNTFDYYYNKCR